MRIKNYHLEEVIFQQAQPPRVPELVEGARGTGGSYGRTPQVMPRKRENYRSYTCSKPSISRLGMPNRRAIDFHRVIPNFF